VKLKDKVYLVVNKENKYGKSAVINDVYYPDQEQGRHIPLVFYGIKFEDGFEIKNLMRGELSYSPILSEGEISYSPIDTKEIEK